MLASDVDAFVRLALPGARFAYHTGSLMADRFKKSDRAKELNKAAAALYRAAQRNVVLLCQRRIADGAFTYYAIKRRRNT